MPSFSASLNLWVSSIRCWWGRRWTIFVTLLKTALCPHTTTCYFSNARSLGQNRFNSVQKKAYESTESSSVRCSALRAEPCKLAATISFLMTWKPIALSTNLIRPSLRRERHGSTSTDSITKLTPNQFNRSVSGTLSSFRSPWPTSQGSWSLSRGSSLYWPNLQTSLVSTTIRRAPSGTFSNTLPRRYTVIWTASVKLRTQPLNGTSLSTTNKTHILTLGFCSTALGSLTWNIQGLTAQSVNSKCKQKTKGLSKDQVYAVLKLKF